MLKHASNASSATATAAAPVNGQLLRTANMNTTNTNSNSNSNNNSNNSNCNGNNNTPPTLSAAAAAAAATAGGTATTTTAATAAATTTTATTTISPVPGATSAGASPTPAAAAVACTARNIHLRPPQPLNISALNASTTTCGNSSTLLNGRIANASTLLNIATAPMKPLTPLTPNGHCNSNGNNNSNSVHHHTYTNQHMLASSSSSNNGHQHQQTQLHHHQQQQQQQHLHLSPHHLNNNNSNNNNNNNQNHNNMHNYSHCNSLAINPNSMLPASSVKQTKHGPGPREVLTSLGLLCLVSLLLALLSLIFLLKISPNSREDALTRSISSAEDFIIVYDVTLALCALSLSLNLCCLLVCAIQFLFAVKLLRSPMFDGRDNKYLEKSSASRTCAVSGFFISIPVFLTGIILYTFNHFHSTPAIITSILIGIGIVFCGGAMVHNVFVWQKEKTISYRSPPMPLNMSLLSTATQLPPPVQFLTNAGYQAHNQPPVMPSSYGQQNHSMLQHHHHPTSVTPVSPNHSHGSFNPLLCTTNTNGVCAPFLVRPATATPPTPKPIAIIANGSCLVGREASGSISPGIPPTLDMSNITISLHELSTLV